MSNDILTVDKIGDWDVEFDGASQTHRLHNTKTGQLIYNTGLTVGSNFKGQKQFTWNDPSWYKYKDKLAKYGIQYTPKAQAGIGKIGDFNIGRRNDGTYYLFDNNNHVIYNNGRMKTGSTSMSDLNLLGQKWLDEHQAELAKYNMNIKAYSPQSTSSKPNYAQQFFEREGVGDLGKMTWLQRRDWINNNKDYISSLSEVDRSALFGDNGKYEGEASENQALAKAFKGYGTWKQQQVDAKAAANTAQNTTAGTIQSTEDSNLSNMSFVEDAHFGGASNNTDNAANEEKVAQDRANISTVMGTTVNDNPWSQDEWGVWHNSQDGTVDFSRSSDPRQYEKLRRSKVRGYYDQELKKLNELYSPRMSPEVKKQWQAKKAKLLEDKKTSLLNMENEVADYSTRYYEDRFGNIGNSSSSDFSLPVNKFQPKTYSESQPYYVYDEYYAKKPLSTVGDNTASVATQKQGGIISYKNYLK